MKKSRILISLLVMALSAALIGGATMAWFTDSADSAPVTMTAGTLLIDIDNVTQVNSEDVNIGNLNPGDTVEFTFDVMNAGTKQLIFMGMLCYNEETGDWNNEMLLDKEYGSKLLSEVLVMEATVVGQAAPFYTGPLTTPSPMEFGEAGLAPGEELSYNIKLTLPTSANNDYQGSSINMALAVMAKQIHPDAEYGEFVCPLPAPFPSSNLQNKLQQAPLRMGQKAPYVEFVSATADSVTLEFFGGYTGTAFFEYRIDGVVQESGTAHPNPRPWIAGQGEVIYPGVSVAPNATVLRTFNKADHDLDEKIEIRLALGGERDWDFNWTTFYVQQ